jgi:hypothetical protein
MAILEKQVFRIRDPVFFVLFWRLDPGSGIEKIPDHISESLETIFWVKNIVNSLLRIRDGKIRIWDPV